MNIIAMNMIVCDIVDSIEIKIRQRGEEKGMKICY